MHRRLLALAMLLGPLLALSALRAGAKSGECPAGSATTCIRGRVVDENGPVRGARVGVRGSPHRGVTDVGGQFAIPTHGAKAPLRVVASRPGARIAGAAWRGDSEPLVLRLEYPAAYDSSHYAWIASAPDPAHPEQCGNCHGEIYRQWSKSGHARSAVNPYFRNLYDGTDWHGNENLGLSLLDEAPEASGVCFSCHVPSLKPDVTEVSDLRKTGGVAREGVHCDYCHKVAEVTLDQLGLDHGRFATRLLRPASGQQVFFGPVDDDDRGNSVYSPLYRKSEYCAPCHEGLVLGTHAYGEYSEWLASPYARQGIQCQDCHMARMTGLRDSASLAAVAQTDTKAVAVHGPTRDLAQRLRSHLGLSVTGSQKNDSLDLTVELRVRNVGHRMPTGYPDRALLLWVSATDADGTELPLLDGPRLPPVAGLGDPREGNLAGQPGQMYAKSLEGLDGTQPVPYWRPNRIAFDTRLQPDQSDRVRFRFGRPEGVPFVSVRLVYRRFPKAMAEQKGWPDNDLEIQHCDWHGGE